MYNILLPNVNTLRLQLTNFMQTESVFSSIFFIKKYAIITIADL
jgi:hypothetical protein